MTPKKHPWTAADIETLVDLWGKNLPIPEIAKVLGRRPVIIRAKVSHLRSTDGALGKLLKYRSAYPDGKLTARDIPKIRGDNRPLRLIGLDYGVSAVTIFKVKSRETWKDA